MVNDSVKVVVKFTPCKILLINISYVFIYFLSLLLEFLTKGDKSSLSGKITLCDSFSLLYVPKKNLFRWMTKILGTLQISSFRLALTFVLHFLQRKSSITSSLEKLSISFESSKFESIRLLIALGKETDKSWKLSKVQDRFSHLVQVISLMNCPLKISVIMLLSWVS